MKYRKKPVVIEAVQFLDSTESENELVKFMGGIVIDDEDESKDSSLLIETLEGTMRAGYGDFIIKGVNGEFYPCKPDIFAKTYEEVI